MTVLSEFSSGNILSAAKTFTLVSGSTVLPISGSFPLAPAFLINDVVSTRSLRIRWYATPKILDHADTDVQSEKARPFGGLTGSVLDSPVFGDLIIDLLSDGAHGNQNLSPPLLGGHAGSGSNEIYYYMQDYPVTTASAITDTDGTVTFNYLQIASATGSVRVSQSLSVPSGIGGVSGSFTTPEIFTIFSSSLEYVSGGGGSGWEDYSRLRLYQDEASMNAAGEIDRSFSSPITSSYQYITGANIAPFSGSGIIMDILFSGSLSGAMFPVNVGANMYSPPTTQSWYRYEPGTSLPSSGVAEFTLQIVGLK